MPEVKIKHVVSFSSEEKPHKAENLLGDDTTKKWKCTPGEKQASVVLQLEKSTKISSIDIGNDGSAFVEVLVGRSSHENIKYQVLLVASSFMSPQDSRVGTSPTRVRMFTHDKLTPEVAAEKWDIVKIVCTQPFNKRASYGLSFLKLHSQAENTNDSKEEESSEKTTKQFGGFKLKEDDSDSKGSSFNPGQQMLMAKKGESSNASIKKEPMRRSRSPDTQKSKEKRRKIEPKQSKPTDVKIAKPIATPVNFDQLKKKNANGKATNSSVSTAQPMKRAATSKNIATMKKKQKVAKPFDQILSGVNFVISGFQNPLRSDLREKALRMGAQYRKDWTPDSTHLICAFPNTPKFRQVVGVRGRIVKKDWVEDCERMKRHISWRNYSMSSDVSSSEEEEEEEEEEKDTEEYKPTTESLQEESDDPYEDSTDEGGDTEDEIEKLQAKETKDVVTKVSSGKNNEYDASTDNDDPYNASTDEENVANVNDENGLPQLPDYFEHKHFLLYGDFDQSVRRLLTRHIIACGGKISKYMDDDVKYVISEQKWDKEFDCALSSNTALVFVRPTWVFNCGAQQKLLSTQPYLISHS